ncbi:anaphase-promoting complex subunit 4-like [Drosophila madeirensis]|uniref:Anaphase-promoting complex subunit 4 n=1 Tax=Drosophila madeirensis TaxID=30013 RepID=A0AAU9F9Y2_DROMD
MASASSIKLYGGRNMDCVVERIEWNNKMDLFAFATDKGEVILQRLNWQKIASFPPPVKIARVRSLCWQLDDSLLAVAYSHGKVAILDVKSETIISRISYDVDIRKVYFSRTIDCQETVEGHTFNTIKDKHNEFLPKPRLLLSRDPVLTAREENPFPEGSPYFMIVVLCNGKFHLLLFGALQVSSIDLTQHVVHPEEFAVYDVQLSGDFNAIYALLRDGQQLKMLHFHNQLLQDSMVPILGVARLCAHILETKNYIIYTLGWLRADVEAVQLEMDNKLAAYASSQPYGSTSANFLELHIFGFATLEVEEFLTSSEKEFKKMAEGVEVSLSDMQDLVFTDLKGGAIRLFYFLNAIVGLSRMPHFYESLVVEEVAVEAMRACGSFYLKACELQRTIDTLVKEMKLFHTWLTFTVMRLSHQEIPENMLLSEAENSAVVELLSSMEPDAEDSSDEEEKAVPKRSLFNLERVSQYLEKACLTQLPPEDPDHLWDQIVAEQSLLGASNIFAPHDKNLSLVQQREKLFNAIDDICQKPTKSMSASFALSSSIICSEFSAVEAKQDWDFVTSCFYVNEAARCDMCAIAISREEALILQFSRADNCFLRCSSIHLKPGLFTKRLQEDYNNLRFVDLQFYNDSFLTILTQSTSCAEGVRPHSCFIQLSLSEATNQCTQHLKSIHIKLSDATVTRSIYDIAGMDAFKCLDGVCDMLAVSGGRRVITVLSDSNRMMTVFETEVDESDDLDMSEISLQQISEEPNPFIHDTEQLDTEA